MAGTPRLDLIPASLVHCICLANKNPCDLCCGKICFLDQGIRVTIRPKKGEIAAALALDGCVFTDYQKKCDGLFVLFRSGRVDIILVELKASHVVDAFEQISHVMQSRKEYRDIVSHLTSLVANPRQIVQRSFIVTTGFLNPQVRQKWEKACGVLPRVITVEKTASSAPDLRNEL